jgi:hypothetical protein
MWILSPHLQRFSDFPVVTFQASNPTIGCHAAAARQGCEVPAALRASNGFLVFLMGISA